MTAVIVARADAAEQFTAAESRTARQSVPFAIH